MDEKSNTYVGIVERLSGRLHLTSPHNPKDAAISLPIEPLFEPYLDKKVKLIVEELGKKE